ncbi:uncharacterized protein G2W53_000027 [Senna tora]|uniref:Uncharacterized protein n=1 Tax=Senna tora TaxID=362788 RepID=A0A835CL70_9FABA|nr:uncharacterized protein G2W53_000027 [Senna tora]
MAFDRLLSGEVNKSTNPAFPSFGHILYIPDQDLLGAQ